MADGPAAPTAPVTKPKPWASLTHRNYRLLWMSYPFSLGGLMMRNTTNAYQVYHLTDSTRLLGLTFLFQGLPFIIVGLFGGTLADFFPKRMVIRTTMILELFLASLLAVLTFTGHIEVWHIFVITFLSASIAACEAPARSALLAKLVPRDLLMNATTLNALNFQAAFLLGPLLAGLFIDHGGPGWSYVANACFILPAILCTTLMRFDDPNLRSKLRINLSTLFEGIIFVIKTRVLMFFVLVDVISMIFGYYPALMPVYAKDILHVSGTGLGSLYAAAPIGALCGLVVVLWLGNVQRKGLLFLTVTIAHGVMLMFFAVSTWFVVSFFILIVMGLFDAMSVSVRHTSFQLLAKDENRGRVVSLVGLIAQASNALGGFYLGQAAFFLGPQSSLVLGGAIGTGIAIFVALTMKNVRNFRAT